MRLQTRQLLNPRLRQPRVLLPHRPASRTRHTPTHVSTRTSTRSSAHTLINTHRPTHVCIRTCTSAQQPHRHLPHGVHPSLAHSLSRSLALSLAQGLGFRVYGPVRARARPLAGGGSGVGVEGGFTHSHSCWAWTSDETPAWTFVWTRACTMLFCDWACRTSNTFMLVLG